MSDRMEDVAEETRAKLLSAVESLLSEKGHASVTLRDITERAGTNVAAVAYHYGSKDALIAEAYRSAISEVTAAQEARIEALPASATLEQIVETWLAPALNPDKFSPREVALWTMIQRAASEHAPALMSAVASHGSGVENSLLSRLRRCVPGVTAPEMQLRHDLVIGAMAAVFSAQTSRHSADAPLPPPTGAIVAWAVGSLSAPSGMNLGTQRSHSVSD